MNDEPRRRNSRHDSPPPPRKRRHNDKHDGADDAIDERRVRRRRGSDGGNRSRDARGSARSPHSYDHGHDRRREEKRTRQGRPDETVDRERERDVTDGRTRHSRETRVRAGHNVSHSSERRHHHRRHHRHHKTGSSKNPTSPSPRPLPYNARRLSRSTDFDTFLPVLARYLELQKQIDIATLGDREVRGRWKGFVARWNAAELAEGWYRPETIEDTLLEEKESGRNLGVPKRETMEREPRRGGEGEAGSRLSRFEHEADNPIRSKGGDDGGDSDEDVDDTDDDYGPTLPRNQDNTTRTSRGDDHFQHQPKPGPGIPSIADLTYRDEQIASDAHEARQALRQERKRDRAAQKERLEDLAPRADAGSHARKMEKRRDLRESNAAFAASRASGGDGDGVPDMTDADLYGGGDGGGGGGGGDRASYEEMKKREERKKTEREARRDEIARARKEERDERVREYREREAGTLAVLKEIAKARFG